MAVLEPSLIDPQVPPQVGGARPRNLHLWLIGIFSILVGGTMFYGLSKENDAAVANRNSTSSVDKADVAAKVSESALEPVFSQQANAAEAIRLAEEKARVDAAFAKLSEKEKEALVVGSNRYGQNSSAMPPLPPVPGGRPDNELSPEIQERNRREASAATSGILAFKGTGAVEKTSSELSSVVAPIMAQRNEMLAQNEARRDALLKQINAADPGSGSSGSGYMSGSGYANNSAGLLAGNRTTDITAGARADSAWAEQAGGRSQAIPSKSVAIPPSTAYLLTQGSVIPAALITAINSDMPGSITAVITQDIYDSIDSRYKLIPKGAKLFGMYSNSVKVGQARVLMAFNRIIFPSGASVMLGGMGGSDAMGRSGVPGEVDNHFFKMFGTSLLIAVIDRIANPAPNNQTNNYYGGGGVQTNAAGQVLSDTSKTILERNRSIPPTIEIEAGERINIVLTKDLELPPSVTRVNQQR